MLDEGSFVYGVDKGNTLGLVAGQSAQLKQRYTFKYPPPMPNFQSIVLAGMGGSALAGQFVSSWLIDRLGVPFTVVRGYRLPVFVNQKTLLFISSYSGNTEETLACYKMARDKHIKPIVLSTGGKLVDWAKYDGNVIMDILPGIPQRLAALSMVKAVATALEKTDLVHGVLEELEEAADWLTDQAATWVQSVPHKQNLAKQLAERLMGNAIVIYGGPTLSAIAQRWKIGFNENSKNVAFSYELPEMNHNEFQGWLNPRTKPFKVIELQSFIDNDRIAIRWDVSNRLLSGKMPSPIEVIAEGETKLKQMLWASMLGDFVSVYLGILNKVDPGATDLIERLKKDLT